MAGNSSNTDSASRSMMAGARVPVVSSAQRGFTLVELVVVMIVIGILAVSVLPRFVGPGAFETRGFHDKVITAIQFARQQAIAQRRQVCVTISAAGAFNITRALAPTPGVCGATQLLNPATGAAFNDPGPTVGLRPPSGVVLAGRGGTVLPLALTFNPLGQPSGAVELRVTGDGGARCVAVEAGTGYVRGFAPC